MQQMTGKTKRLYFHIYDAAINQNALAIAIHCRYGGTKELVLNIKTQK